MLQKVKMIYGGGLVFCWKFLNVCFSFMTDTGISLEISFIHPSGILHND